MCRPRTESVDLTFPEYTPVETEPIYEETVLPSELPSAPKKQNIELPAGAVAAAVALSILAVGIILLICRVKKCEHRRDELMRRAQSLSRGDMNTNIAERVECARALDGGILSLLEYLGLKPEPGRAAERVRVAVDNVLGELSRRDFADISTYMSAAEFGQRIQPGELLAISEYARDLLAYARRSANTDKAALARDGRADRTCPDSRYFEGCARRLRQLAAARQAVREMTVNE